MLVRIVKMTFEESGIDSFLEIFMKNKEKIRSSEGCTSLKLLRQTEKGNVFFTYSTWEGPEYLEMYRNSDTFKNVWPETKALFAEKPEAWSTDIITELD